MSWRFDPHAYGRQRPLTYDGGNTCSTCKVMEVEAGFYMRSQLDPFTHTPVRGSYIQHGPDANHPRFR